MKCPVDQTELSMAERQGIEIDYCPTCRGVWLDRGELDKIIERSRPADRPPPGGRRDEPRGYGDEPRGYRDDERRHGEGGGYHGHRGRRKRRRESFLEDLFDFDF